MEIWLAILEKAFDTTDAQQTQALREMATNLEAIETQLDAQIILNFVLAFAIISLVGYGRWIASRLKKAERTRGRL